MIWAALLCPQSHINRLPSIWRFKRALQVDSPVCLSASSVAFFNLRLRLTRLFPHSTGDNWTMHDDGSSSWISHGFLILLSSIGATSNWLKRHDRGRKIRQESDCRQRLPFGRPSTTSVHLKVTYTARVLVWHNKSLSSYKSGALCARLGSAGEQSPKRVAHRQLRGKNGDQRTEIRRRRASPASNARIECRGSRADLRGALAWRNCPICITFQPFSPLFTFEQRSKSPKQSERARV